MIKEWNEGKIVLGDCLEVMKEIPDRSVDMILCDLPYGMTSRNKWDEIIPLDGLWEQYNRIIKDNGAIVLFGMQPFATDLINSNRKMFRYEWVWNKKIPSGFFNCNRMPLRVHELLLVFYKKLPVYNPQFWYSTPYKGPAKGYGYSTCYESGDSAFVRQDNTDGKRYPLDIITFSQNRAGMHPTAKPIDLCEYMIKTYTNEGETVLDNCLGSGTTAIACLNTGRKFIGIEKEQEYFDLSCQRIEQTLSEREDIID